MNNQPLHLLILTGGPSTEHEVSLRSCKSITDNLNKRKYKILLAGIEKNGTWLLRNPDDYLNIAEGEAFFTMKPGTREVELKKAEQTVWLIDSVSRERIDSVDVVFPVLHGAYGEDGVLQGILRAVGVAFVGVDLIASAIGMDKDICKRLWRDAGIPIARYEIITPPTRNEFSYTKLSATLGSTLFVKPANAGSSVGVHKVSNESEWDNALDDAFLYDRKLLVEEAISGKEIECAVLGNEYPEASVVGEIIPIHSFYSYEAKYVDDQGAKIRIPADIPADIALKIRKEAIKAYKAIGAEGLSRVDFFLQPDGNIVINEINTMPGFTSISMYPKMWEATGLSYMSLLDKLIALALERQNAISKLKVVKD